MLSVRGPSNLVVGSMAAAYRVVPLRPVCARQLRPHPEPMLTRTSSLRLALLSATLLACREAAAPPPPPALFSATVTGLLDTTFTGQGAYMFAFGGLRLQLVAPGDMPRLSILVVGADSLVGPGEYTVGQGGPALSLWFGCCSDQRASFQAQTGVLRILERRGTRLRGELAFDGDGYIDMNTPTPKYGRVQVRAEFAADVTPE